jgi:hypothetical protein
MSDVKKEVKTELYSLWGIGGKGLIAARLGVSY